MDLNSNISNKTWGEREWFGHSKILATQIKQLEKVRVHDNKVSRVKA